MCIGYVTVIELTEAEKQFLYLFRCHVNNEDLPDGYHFDVGRVFSLAQIHNVLPAIYDISSKSDENVSLYKMSAVRLYAGQVLKNTAFRDLYSELQTEGTDIIVLKGPVCAVCYNNPDYRLSSDFDIVVSDEQKEQLHHFFINKGFQQKKDSYFHPDSGLYIEVSTQLGEGEGVIKELADRTFDGYRDRCVVIDSYKSLGYTDCLVYLVYHAFKHFIGSGFGIRQLADINLFIKKFREEIDFAQVCDMLSEMGIMSFFENVLVACKKIFLLDDVLISLDESAEYICTDGFIEDLLSAGVFGKSSEDRLHSANLVLNAVNNKNKTGLMNAIFPPYRVMKNKFGILERFPILLPFFWFIRFFEYVIKSFGKNKKTSPAKSIEIARNRIDMMKKMGIIEQ